MGQDENKVVLNLALMQLPRRADKADPVRLIRTFVDVGHLFTLLSIPDNQVVFGRRGTGKTHALRYLAGMVREKLDVASYSDLTNLGSSGGIYADPSIPLPERATRLLVDALSDIHENLLEVFVRDSEVFDLSQVGPLLDEFGEAIVQVKVVGTVEREEAQKAARVRTESLSLGANASLETAGFSLGASKSGEIQGEYAKTEKVSGLEKHTVHFGAVRRVLEKIAAVVSPQRIWIILDEWSSVPIDLQPYLADLLRRSVFPIRGITVKIAAIEYRSRFQLSSMPGDYIGIEVGADASTDVDLDDFMVFDNDEARAREFFKALFHKHLAFSDILADSGIVGLSADQIVAAAFTQVTAFDELVRAAEGVPRDAIHIASLAAQYADHEKIAVPHVRRAAKTWYQTGKEGPVYSRDRTTAMLHWIVDTVIGDRKARAFMLRSGIKHALIEDLFDSRVLHILKRGISTHDEAGARYDAYKLDYGCYVDLMSTSRAPKGLFEVHPLDDTSGYVDVPSDDYRSIRRAILDIEEFERRFKHT